MAIGNRSIDTPVRQKTDKADKGKKMDITVTGIE
jgi:hypothetical protein